MKSYFVTKERQDRLKSAINSWNGTPYRHCTGVKNMGVDCIYYFLHVYNEAGLGIVFTPPIYPPDRYLHVAAELLLGGLRDYNQLGKWFMELPHKNPINGDLCCYKFGKATSHPAIYFNGNLNHSILGMGACTLNFKNFYPKRFTHIFRPIEA